VSTQIFTSAKDGKRVTGYDPRIRTWYICFFVSDTYAIITEQQYNRYVNASAAFGEPNGVLSPPYIDVATNQVIVTAALAFDDERGQLAGVAAIDIDASILKKVTSSVALSDNDGYSYVLNSDLAIVMHPRGDLSRVQSLQDVEYVVVFVLLQRFVFCETLFV
jgi:hypothetical protein